MGRAAWHASGRRPGPAVPPTPSTPARPSRLCCSARCPDAHLWLPTRNFARNSSMTHSNIEFASLELQRFWGISKNDRDKLRAKFGWRWCHRHPLRPGPAAHVHRLPRVPRPGPPVPPAPSATVGLSWLIVLGASARCLEARPGPAAACGVPQPRPSRPSNAVWFVVLSFWDAPMRVVTNVVNRRCFSCELLIRCYKRRQSDGFFAENSGFSD